MDELRTSQRDEDKKQIQNFVNYDILSNLNVCDKIIYTAMD
jgi:hypothetical protein